MGGVDLGVRRLRPSRTADLRGPELPPSQHVGVRRVGDVVCRTEGPELFGFRPTVDLERGSAEEVTWSAGLAESWPDLDAAG